MALQITSEKNVTIDDVVAEATTIWRKVRARKLEFGDTEAARAIMDETRKEHPQFCQAYPIVHRYICEMQEYHAQALRMWLTKIAANPWHTESEYLDAQADYASILFRKRNPRANRTEINNVRRNIRAILQDEHEKFQDYLKHYEQTVTDKEDKLRQINLDDLREFAEAAGPEGLALAETIRAVSELSGRDIDIAQLAASAGTPAADPTTLTGLCAADLLS